MSKSKRIIITLQIEGVHKWTNCPFKEVEYLRNAHRHLFFIKLEKKVTHNDRDIEILMLKQEVKDHIINIFYNKNYGACNFGEMSCEDIAELILDKFDCQSVEVLEDNENGAKIIKK